MYDLKRLVSCRNIFNIFKKHAILTEKLDKKIFDPSRYTVIYNEHSVVNDFLQTNTPRKFCRLMQYPTLKTKKNRIRYT